jgi:hypothetical protein
VKLVQDQVGSFLHGGQMMRENGADRIAKVKQTAANISQTLGHRRTPPDMATRGSRRRNSVSGDATG